MKPRRYVVLAYIAPMGMWIPMSRRFRTPRAAQRRLVLWQRTAAISLAPPAWTDLRVVDTEGVLPERTLGVR